MAAEYTNVSRLVDKIKACSRDASDVMNRMRALSDEATRVGGDTRFTPYFYVLDATTGVPKMDTPRIDLGFTLSDLNFALSAFKILSGGSDNGVAGLAAQIDAQWASLDKIKV